MLDGAGWVDGGVLVDNLVVDARHAGELQYHVGVLATRVSHLHGLTVSTCGLNEFHRPLYFLL